MSSNGNLSVVEPNWYRFSCLVVALRAVRRGLVKYHSPYCSISVPCCGHWQSCYDHRNSTATAMVGDHRTATVVVYGVLSGVSGHCFLIARGFSRSMLFTMVNSSLWMKLLKTSKIWKIFLSINATMLFVTPPRLMLQMIVWSVRRSCDTDRPAAATNCHWCVPEQVWADERVGREAVRRSAALMRVCLNLSQGHYTHYWRTHTALYRHLL